MIINLGKKLNNLANILSSPLYAVGGVVRNFLIDKSISYDVDLAGAIGEEEFCQKLEQVGFKIDAIYRATGTVTFKDEERKYEFTSFRKENYVRGEHTPYSTEFTTSIEEDARRRDFKCNAVYYDIKNDKIVDILGGVEDVKNKRLDTVIDAEKVFRHDGLRLMRLARFTGELNFKPTESVLSTARKYADNITDISPERIYAELKMILTADQKYPFSDKNGHYSGLKVLDQTRVLDRIIPELTLGREMEQRKDYHKFDVLEHCLKSVLYSQPQVRLAALLHDVGKPSCMAKYGKYHGHNLEGERIAEKVLRRLKVDKATVKAVKFLTREHMADMDCKTGRAKVRRFIVENYDMIEQLFMIKQADFKASKEENGECPTITKWKEILREMRADGTPFCLKDLKISAKDAINAGVKEKDLGVALKRLLFLAVADPKMNDKERLIKELKPFVKK